MRGRNKYGGGVMSLEIAQLIFAFGDERLARAGEEAGLERDHALGVAYALAAHMGKGRDTAVRRAAASAGIAEAKVLALLGRIMLARPTRAAFEGGVAGRVGGLREGLMPAAARRRA